VYGSGQCAHLPLLVRKGRLHLWQILISTPLEYQKIAGKFNESRTAKADFVFLKRASRFFEKPSKNRLCRAVFVCATRFLLAQREICLCRAIFVCAEHIFFVQCVFCL
jgi:hypothetical protein